MRKQIITGTTGTGKTYKAINDCKKNSERFIYYSPCKQLVIESYIKYGNIDKDSILTGEIKIKNDNNYFAVYEIYSEELFNKIDTVIIDESHYITDTDRPIKAIIKLALKLNKNVKLLTATKNFDIKDVDFETIELTSRQVIPTKISDEEKVENLVGKGYQTIIFCKSITEMREIVWNHEYGITSDTKYKFISGKNDLKEKLEIQKEFKERKIQVLLATDCVAQGLNFPCELVVIRNNPYDNKERIVQKIGRLGRGLTDDKDLYYYFEDRNFDTYFREYIGSSNTECLFNEDIRVENIYIFEEEEKEEEKEEYVEYYVFEKNLEYVDVSDVYKDIKESYDYRKSSFIKWYEENCNIIPSDKVVCVDWYEDKVVQLKEILKEIYIEYKKYFEENEKFFVNFIKNEMKNKR